jgi:hypothetical protein
LGQSAANDRNREHSYIRRWSERASSPVIIAVAQVSNIRSGYRLESRAYHGLTEQFIGHSHFIACFRIKHWSAFERLTENPRVGGSIPPLATIQIFQIKKLHQSA